VLPVPLLPRAELSIIIRCRIWSMADDPEGRLVDVEGRDADEPVDVRVVVDDRD